jgi:hypothetical protein
MECEITEKGKARPLGLRPTFLMNESPTSKSMHEKHLPYTGK